MLENHEFRLTAETGLFQDNARRNGQNWIVRCLPWKGAVLFAEPPPENAPPVTELNRKQRRVLGVLLEKAFTTPEQYPLTPKSLTSGCNQKSNRSPVVEYDEAEVLETLEGLRELGLVGEVHTDSGRTSRFRHYMRHRFKMSEQQLAILTELLLRGRQMLGELRTRAGRMVPIESLEGLRRELSGLIEMNLLQTTGDLERRGTEVDHNLYRANENMTLEKEAIRDDEPAPPPASSPASSMPPQTDAPANAQVTALETAVEELRGENRDLHDQLENIRQELADLKDAFDDLRRDLGG